LQTGDYRRDCHVAGILHTVHMADFVAVESRYRQFFDALFSEQHLNDNFSVEVKIIRVELEEAPRREHVWNTVCNQCETRSIGCAV